MITHKQTIRQARKHTNIHPRHITDIELVQEINHYVYASTTVDLVNNKKFYTELDPVISSDIPLILMLELELRDPFIACVTVCQQ